MRTWDVYDNKSQLEVLQHSHDVLALAWRPDGKQLASATLDGQVYFWNAQVQPKSPASQAMVSSISLILS